MKTPVSTYHTRTGLIALQITRHTDHTGRVTYSYDGKHGAGSGHQLPHVQSTVRLILRCHKGITLKEGPDILTA